ncbi:helix-turn-helix domain-containing protein [Comamonas sp. GB3 AK4-5]|uniref:helix-turn-helix domain-containing protein n=1 Tax=Comamonas sp. GB3 AK4-5 TaxID=3231487 RepID=UPI00351EDE84
MANHSPPESLIPRRVREERMLRGLTLEQLAAQADVSRAMISKIERGESSPTAVLLSRISDAMGLSLSALMSEPRAASPAIRRMQEQPLWADPETGYLRRLISPPGDNGDVEIVAVELPAGKTVTFAATESLHSDDQILLLEGQLTLSGDATAFVLQPGDCARMSTQQTTSFGNTGTVTARYLVIKRHYR